MYPNKYNIYEAYLYTFKKFILVLSYTPGFNIQEIIDDIKPTFNLHLIKLDGPTDLNSNSIFNYNKLNSEVNDYLEKNKEVFLTTTTYGTGILIYGLNFPTNLLKFDVDLHLHFSLSTKLFLENNPSLTLDDYNNFKIILEDNKINKYFNIKSMALTEINNSVFDKLIDYFEFKVYGENYNMYSTKKKSEDVPKIEQKIDKEPITEESEEDSIDKILLETEKDIDTDTE